MTTNRANNQEFRVRLYEASRHGNRGSSPFGDAVHESCLMNAGGRRVAVNRVERVLRDVDWRDDCYLLNFITSRYDGPGRISGATLGMPMGLTAEEYFAYEQSMLYDPEANLVILESVRIGMRYQGIAKFFSNFLPEGSQGNIRLMPRLDQEAIDKILNHREITKLECELVIPPIRNPALTEKLGLIDSVGRGFGGVGKIAVVVYAEKQQTRASFLQTAKDFVRGYLDKAEDLDVSRLTVQGKGDDDDNLKLIDLIAQPVTYKRLLPIDGTIRTINHEDRWRALLDIRQMELP